MGHHNSSESCRGLNTNHTLFKMKLFVVLFALAAAVAAEPGYYGYGYLHQQNWPSVRAPGFEATCHGCRPAPLLAYHHLGKRDAEAEPGYGFYGYPYYRHGFYGLGRGVAAHPTGTSYVGPTTHGLGKREAEAEPGYGVYGYHPYGYGLYAPFHYRPAAVSYEHRSPQGLRGKRDAEAGVAAHPTGTSFVGRTVFGYPRVLPVAYHHPAYFYGRGYYHG